MRRQRWEEQGEEARGVELLMPLAVVLLRRDPKVRVGFGGHKGGQQKHARSEGCAGCRETLTFLVQGWTKN